MWQYLVKRLLLLFVTLFGICLISFVIVTLAPGDPAAMAAGIGGGGTGPGSTSKTGSAKDQVLEHTRKALYLDRPRVINFSPNTRRSIARDLAKKIVQGSDFARQDALGEVKGEIGTAAVDVFIEEAQRYVDDATLEAKRRADVLSSLDALAGRPEGADVSALDAALAPYRLQLEGRGPRLSKSTTVPARAKAWATWLRERESEPWIGVTALLDALDAIVPAADGGPGTRGKPDERASAWKDWWAKNGARYSTDASEKAVLAYLNASKPEQPERLKDLERIGSVATPAIMSELESSSGERRYDAAFALSLVAHKPWDLKPKPADFEQEWEKRKAELDSALAHGQLTATTHEARLRDLGAKADYVAAKIAARRRDDERNLARWWFRAEEEFVDFSVPRQLVRAFTQTQFGKWVRSLVRGLDLGQSFAYKGKDVIDLIKERFWISFWLNFASIILTYVIAIPLGVFSATHPRTLADRTTTVGLFVLYSLPSFWVGAILILLFTGKPIGVAWFPSHGIESMNADMLGTWDWLVDRAWHMALPVVCLTYGGVAYISRQMRAGMLETIRLDYIRTARAKGLPENIVIFKHAMRNSLIPIVTILAFLLPAMFGGSIIIESIFSIEGLGKLMFDAILQRDYPVIMADVFISALLTLFGILLSDITYAVVDPRIELK